MSDLLEVKSHLLNSFLHDHTTFLTTFSCLYFIRSTLFVEVAIITMLYRSTVLIWQQSCLMDLRHICRDCGKLWLLQLATTMCLFFWANHMIYNENIKALQSILLLEMQRLCRCHALTLIFSQVLTTHCFNWLCLLTYLNDMVWKHQDNDNNVSCNNKCFTGCYTLLHLAKCSKFGLKSIHLSLLLGIFVAWCEHLLAIMHI